MILLEKVVTKSVNQNFGKYRKVVMEIVMVMHYIYTFVIVIVMEIRTM